MRVSKDTHIWQVQQLGVAAVTVHGIDENPCLCDGGAPLVQIGRRRRARGNVVAKDDLDWDSSELLKVRE